MAAARPTSVTLSTTCARPPSAAVRWRVRSIVLCQPDPDRARCRPGVRLLGLLYERLYATAERRPPVELVLDLASEQVRELPPSRHRLAAGPCARRRQLRRRAVPVRSAGNRPVRRSADPDRQYRNHLKLGQPMCPGRSWVARRVATAPLEFSVARPIRPFHGTGSTLAGHAPGWWQHRRSPLAVSPR